MTARALLLSLLVAVAAAAAADDSIKVGYVNAVKLVESAPQGEAALKKLEAEFGPRDQELRTMRDEISALEDELEKNSLVLPEAERVEKERTLRDMKRRLNRSREVFREDYNLRRNEELGKLQRVVTEAIVEIAKAEGYDLILQDSVYASQSIDITEKVLLKLRENR